MKYTIMGFNQEKLIKLGLDVTDALILRWFIDFKDTGKMYTEVIDDDYYYWIKYDNLLKDIPIINIKKVALGRRLKKMTETKVLKQYIKKEGGTYSMYSIGNKYIELLESIEGCTSKYNGVELQSITGLNSEVQTKNYSTKENYSTKKDYSIKELTQEQINKLNEKYPDIDIEYYIEKIKDYEERKNKKYSSYYITALNWIKKDIERNNTYSKIVTIKEKENKEVENELNFDF